MRDHVSDELISAYLDGEVTVEERRRVRNALDESLASRRLYEDFECLRAGLQCLPRYQLPDDFSERVLDDVQRLRRSDGAAVSLPRPPDPTRAARRYAFRTAKLVAAAASLAALLGYALLVSFQPDEGPPVAKPPAVVFPADEPPRDTPPAGVTYGVADRRLPQWLVVCDLAITPRGQRQRIFERALQNVGIAFDAAHPGVRLTADASDQLAHLLDSGFVDGLTKTGGKIESDEGESRLQDFQPFDVIEVIHAQATGAQFDALFMHDLRHRKPDCHLQFDFVMHPQQRDVLVMIGGETWSVAVREAPGNPFSRSYRLQLGFALHSTDLAKFPTLGIDLAPRDDRPGTGGPSDDPPPGFPGAAKKDGLGRFEPSDDPLAAGDDESTWYYEILFIVRNLEQQPGGSQGGAAARPDP